MLGLKVNHVSKRGLSHLLYKNRLIHINVWHSKHIGINGTTFDPGDWDKTYFTNSEYNIAKTTKISSKQNTSNFYTEIRNLYLFYSSKDIMTLSYMYLFSLKLIVGSYVQFAIKLSGRKRVQNHLYLKKNHKKTSASLKLRPCLLMGWQY